MSPQLNNNSNGNATANQFVDHQNAVNGIELNMTSASDRPGGVSAVPPSMQAILERDSLLQTIARERVVARRWSVIGQLLMLILVLQAIVSVVSSLDSYARDNANCKKPIPIWLLVNFGLSFVINTAMVVSSCIKHHTQHTESRQQTAATIQKFGFVMILPLLAWACVGAVWVWGPDSTECDDTLHKSAQTSVGIFLVMAALNLVMAPFAYMFLKKKWALEKIKEEERKRIIKAGNDAEQVILQIHVQPQQPITICAAEMA